MAGTSEQLPERTTTARAVRSLCAQDQPTATSEHTLLANELASQLDPGVREHYQAMSMNPNLTLKIGREILRRMYSNFLKCQLSIAESKLMHEGENNSG